MFKKFFKKADAKCVMSEYGLHMAGNATTITKGDCNGGGESDYCYPYGGESD